MKVAILLGAFLATVLWAEAALAQLGTGPTPSPALIGETPPVAKLRPVKRPARFSIVVVEGGTLLLDAATGDTWHLVLAGGKTKTPIRWEPIPRKPHADDDGPPSEETESSGAAAADSEEADPFGPGKSDRREPQLPDRVKQTKKPTD
ncbi:MAG TPA: hypothetical protein VGG30_08680 [Pirellulales bacterium]|jgi:hypothetical protein